LYKIYIVLGRKYVAAARNRGNGGRVFIEGFGSSKVFNPL
jgi:hypothetical protein